MVFCRSMTAKEKRTTIEALLRCNVEIWWLEKNDWKMILSIAFRELSKTEEMIVCGDHWSLVSIIDGCVESENHKSRVELLKTEANNGEQQGIAAN